MKFLLVFALGGAALLASRSGHAEVPPTTVIYPETGVVHVDRGSSGSGSAKDIEAPSPGTPLKVSGIVFTGLGGLNTVLGLTYFLVYGRDNVEGSASAEAKALTIGMMACGAAMTAGGIAMIVAGRAKNADARRRHPVAVAVAPSAASVRVGF